MNKKTIREFVLKLGITPDLSGYEYIISAIELLMNKKISSYTSLYVAVAEIHHTTSSKVERAIRHAVTTILNSFGGFDLLQEIFHCSILSEKLPNSKFLALCVETLKYDRVGEL